MDLTPCDKLTGFQRELCRGELPPHIMRRHSRSKSLWLHVVAGRLTETEYEQLTGPRLKIKTRPLSRSDAFERYILDNAHLEYGTFGRG